LVLEDRSLKILNYIGSLNWLVLNYIV
jgi:hypothetical protein